MADRAHLHLVLPHQLFDEQLGAPQGTRFVLIEHDLMFRQYAFHAQKLVLHRASMTRFARRLRAAGYEVETLTSDPRRTSGRQLTALVRDLAPRRVTCFDVVDDWLSRDLSAALARGGHELRHDEVLESPNFLTRRDQLRDWFAQNPARMQDFYRWQRLRLGIMVHGGEPAGGRWSYDEDNRRRLPRGYEPAQVRRFAAQDPDVREAIDWVTEEFPDAPGDPREFAWPTTAEEAREALHDFTAHRLREFGPYEDAVSASHPYLNHSVLSPALNCGLLGPREVVAAVLTAAGEQDAPLASVEGFVRQVIGWREYMRATYHLYGRRMRTGNRLGHDRDLDRGWWRAGTGLGPVDLVIGRMLRTGYAHHIERLMILGNAMCLLRIHPHRVHEWFMAMSIDAYDWVMVPNVYAMSQFAVGSAITTKPYVSGSSYLRRMSDLPDGDWTRDWDGLYWAFVHDHREVFETNRRSQMIPRLWDDKDADDRRRLLERAAVWLGS